MKTIIPNKLKEGDLIRIIAPSMSCATLWPDVKKRAEKKINEMNFPFIYSKNSLKKDILESSSVKDRINDLHEAFKNKKVKGIICVRGGYNVNTLLPYIDWDLIKKNPKPLVGYSDITVLLNAIYAKTGMVTYSGPTLTTFGFKEEKNVLDYMVENWKKCLMSSSPFLVESSRYIAERKVKIKKNKGTIVLQEGQAEGVVIGGGLCSLNLLQGAEYMPSIKNSILFIEQDDFGGKNTPKEFERNLESLLQLPYANTIKGIVFGRFQKGADMNIKKLKYILSSKKISKNIPVIADADFGHTYPMFTFPIGGTVKIEARSAKVKIEVLKH